jgi:hypothetical protein
MYELPVACPRCRAAPGELCKSCNGNPTLTHIGRLDQARTQGLVCRGPTVDEVRQINAELRRQRRLAAERVPHAHQSTLSLETPR